MFRDLGLLVVLQPDSELSRMSTDPANLRLCPLVCVSPPPPPEAFCQPPSPPTHRS